MAEGAVPFELWLDFEFRATVDVARRPVTTDDYADAWAGFWRRFAEEVCSPPPPPQRSKTRDWAYDPGRVVAFAPSGPQTSHALAVHPDDFHPAGLKATVERNGLPIGPSGDFLRSLSRAPRGFRGQTFAVGLGQAYGEDGRLFTGKVVEISLGQFEAWEGSLWAKGRVGIAWVGVAALLPMFLTTFNNASSAVVQQAVSQGIAERKIELRLLQEQVECVAVGDFHFKRETLIADLEQRFMGHPDHGRICEVQAALFALGLSPGQIDGKLGPQTLAAIKAFEKRYLLDSGSFNSPVFFSTLARALTGEQPPTAPK